MGVFDFFGKEQKIKGNKIEFEGKTLSNNGGSISFFNPTSFEDVEGIIDVLKTGRNAVVKFIDLKPDSAKRIIDMLSGAVYALNGGVCEIEKNVLMFSPSGVEIN